MIIDVEKNDLLTDALKSKAHIKDAKGNPVMKLLKDVEAKSLGDSDVYSTIKKQKIINNKKEFKILLYLEFFRVENTII